MMMVMMVLLVVVAVVICYFAPVALPVKNATIGPGDHNWL